jgi:hypothetical protein
VSKIAMKESAYAQDRVENHDVHKRLVSIMDNTWRRNCDLKLHVCTDRQADDANGEAFEPSISRLRRNNFHGRPSSQVANGPGYRALLNSKRPPACNAR